MDKNQLILFGSLGAIVLAAVLMLLGVLPGIKKNVNNASANLVMWSPDDSPEIWKQIIAVYNGANPNIHITYVQKDSLTYENELLNALAALSGPDIWVMKGSWILKHKDKVFPLPEVSLQFTKNDFKRLFADATFEFIQDQQITALPTSLDTLALYYNKDILNSENIPNPPATWDDVISVSRKVTKISLTGDIIQGGIAMGTSKNVQNFVDILSALFIQNGLSILDIPTRKSDLGTEKAANAAEFYRGFADSLRKNYSWSDSLSDSVEAFAQGKIALLLGFAGDYERITSRNPRLNFDVAPLPQQKGETIRVNYGRPLGLTVSRTSQSPVEAWRFLLYATTDPGALKFYLNASNHPPAYRQFVTADFLAPYLFVFQSQILAAKTWLQPDEKLVSSIFQTMVQSSRGNIQNVLQATSLAKKQLEDLLKTPEEKRLGL